MPRRPESNPRDRHDDFLSESDLSSSSSVSSDDGAAKRRGPYRDEPDSARARSKGYEPPALSDESGESDDDEGREARLEDEEKLIGQMVAADQQQQKKKKSKAMKKGQKVWNMKSLGDPSAQPGAYGGAGPSGGSNTACICFGILGLVVVVLLMEAKLVPEPHGKLFSGVVVVFFFLRDDQVDYHVGSSGGLSTSTGTIADAKTSSSSAGATASPTKSGGRDATESETDDAEADATATGTRTAAVGDATATPTKTSDAEDNEDDEEAEGPSKGPTDVNNVWNPFETLTGRAGGNHDDDDGVGKQTKETKPEGGTPTGEGVAVVATKRA
ncbi:hypothetical protein JCM11491_003507 [Sporobolomyces phaffii]